MVRSYRYSVLAAVVWVSIIVTTQAQQSNQQQANGSPDGGPNANSPGTRIAIVYRDSFYDPNYGIRRLVNAIESLDQEFQVRKIELESLKQQIEQLNDETGETAPTAPPTTAQTKLSQLEQLKKDLQRKAEEAEGEYSKHLHESLNPIFEDLDKVIKTFAQQHGIALILDASKLDEALLYVTESLDLTRAFVMEFNRTNPSAVPSPR